MPEGEVACATASRQSWALLVYAPVDNFKHFATPLAKIYKELGVTVRRHSSRLPVVAVPSFCAIETSCSLEVTVTRQV